MSIFILFNLLGGRAVFMLGMVLMNKYIAKLAGAKLKSIILKLSKSMTRGYLTGLFLTFINQSSAATTVLECALVGAGLMTFNQSIGITLGCELGSTFTAQLVAFRVTDYALLLVAIGQLPLLFVKSKKAKSFFNIVMGFGLLFLGMDIMSKSLAPLKTHQPFLDALAKLENPIIGLIVGILFTLIVQSSGATSGITVAMAMTGTMTLAQAIPLNLGASVGTCFTAILSSMNLNREAKRVAYIHVLFQFAGAMTVLALMYVPYGADNIWITFVKWFTQTVIRTDDVARQIAMAHTLMALQNHVIVITTLPLWLGFFNWLYPSKQEEEAFGPKYLDANLLDNPPLALEQAGKEIYRVGEIVKEMLGMALEAFEKRDDKLAEQVSLTDNKADMLRNATVLYLTRIGQMDLDEEDSQLEIASLLTVNDFEAIGDIIDKNLVPLSKKMIKSNCCFSPEGWEDIIELHDKVMKNMEDVLLAYKENDHDLAQKIAMTKSEVGQIESELRLRHVSRLHQGITHSINSSAIHIDLLDQYKRINSHIVSVAYLIQGHI